ncbi:zinc finger protein 91-like [Spodoptera litura]|uniref:Zinc finger protein 91-like n=1 Tax=Spodoptera litura TaxID=69820 RepID=A0A9J7DXX7_SPOLT|nr:zinc finger protein 91-like [Spodoptera litura]
MNVNYDRVCRLCLSSRGELLPIFPTTSSDDSEPPVLALKIKDCVSIQINENDDLPTNVCRKCMDNVNNWHVFKTVCERTQNKLQSLKDGSQLEEVKIKSEPLSDEAYDDGVVIDGSYPVIENAGLSNKVQPEGPPILASLGLTPRSDKGAESENNDEDEEETNEPEPAQTYPKVPHMPEVSITVMRPTGETLHARQGIHQLASKDCLVCGRSYRYSHNARRHELTAHSFDRYTNKITPKKTLTHLQPKLRPNPFNPKARMMPNPISHKMQFLNKNIPAKIMPANKVITPQKPIPIKTSKTTPNNLPYPLRIKALKDLQIKKKEPQILKTLLTSKPEVLVSEPEILNSGPESPETLISEPEIASFQVEAILTEPDADAYDPQDVQQGDEEGDEDMNNQSQNYDTVDMDSENEIEIARQQGMEQDGEDNVDGEDNIEQGDDDNNMEGGQSDNEKDGNDDTAESQENMEEEDSMDVKPETEGDMKDDEGQEDGEHEESEMNHNENEEEDDDDLPMSLAPVVEINEGVQGNSFNSEVNEDDEELDETADPNETLDDEEPEPKVLDPDKTYVTKTQRDFIQKYRDIIQQINTKRCLCCDREHPRRKAVIQHLQKNGHKVPKHTCYNCVITFGHIGALLSHMRSNTCTNLWKIIYDENGITDDQVLEDEPKEVKVQYKDIFNARSYACKLCPAKFQLKQFIMKHVLDTHEDGQSRVPLTCVHCRARFKDKSLLKKHIRKGDCTVYVACDLCSEKFVNMQDFNDHALAVHAGSFDQSDNQSKCVDGRPTDCPLCGKKNSSYPNLVKHLKIIHSEEKPHYCQHCDAKFEQATDLNKHIYMEHSDRTLGMVAEPDMSIVKEEAEEYHYSCTECNAIFETVDAWTDHQVAEHNQIAHHCDQCEKKFLRPSELAEHKNTHLRVKFYPCSVCPNSYGTPQKLSEHVQEAHAGLGPVVPTEAEFFCDICIRSFKSRQAYSNHMRIHAKVPTTNRKPGIVKGSAPQIVVKPIKQYPVAQPGFSWFKPNYNIPNAPYSCDICGKGFMHKKNIWKHKKVLHADILADRHDSEENTMQASTEEEEFNPDENGAILSTPQFNSFNFTNFPNNVQQSNTETMPYSCELCFKRFPLKTSLWKHKRAKHGIVNPGTSGSNDTTTPSASGGEGSSRSSCTICRITFSDKKSYYRHRKNVHKSTVQMCKICGKPLTSTLELYEHLKAAHARELLGYNANQGSSKSQDMTQEVEPDYENDQESADPSVDYQARYPCDTCGKQFVGLLALQNHQCINQLPAQPQTFDCEICHKSYTSISALKSHRGWHLRSPDGKAAANNSGLWMPQHKVTSKISKHEVIDPSQLAKVTHTSTPVSASVAKRRLPPEVEVTVVNPNKKLRSDDSVDMDTQNSGSIEDRYCTICDKEFTKRAAYQRHMDEVHQPNSVFCPVCDKSFTRKSTLLIHMKKHYESGEGSSSATGQGDDDMFSCDLCGAQYDSDEALRAHRARHHGEEEESAEESDDGNVPVPPPGEFTCAQCGDGVATPRDLIAHRTMHATPTKFFCNICKVYFARALDLSSHTRARHADNEKVFFPCAMCDRFYMNKKSLQRHIEMAH